MPCRSESGSLAKATWYSIFQADKPSHRVRAGTVHADLAVVVDRHERESGVNGRINYDDVQSIKRIDRLPVGACGSTQGVDCKLQLGIANRVHVHDILEIANIGQHEILLMRRRSLDRAFERNALDASISCSQQLVRAASTQCVTSVSAGPPLVGLYLKPPSSGGLCEGVMTIPSARCSVRPRL